MSQISSRWQLREDMLLQAEECTECVLRAGVLLMSCGAEVYRVEETMTRLGNSIPGVLSCESYVTVTGVLCTVQVGSQSVTRVSRIHGTSRNLSIVSALNALSRDAEKNHYTSEELMNRITEIENIPDYSWQVKALWGAVGAAGFSMFFGGGLYELLFVFVIGLIVRFISVACDRVSLNSYLINSFLAFIVAVFAVLFHRLVPSTSQSNMIISSIMLLVPGLMITNALRDSVMDEPLSAVVLLMQAILIACAIAIGVLIGLYVMEALV